MVEQYNLAQLNPEQLKIYYRELENIKDLDDNAKMTYYDEHGNSLSFRGFLKEAAAYWIARNYNNTSTFLQGDPNDNRIYDFLDNLSIEDNLDLSPGWRLFNTGTDWDPSYIWGLTGNRTGGTPMTMGDLLRLKKEGWVLKPYREELSGGETPMMHLGIALFGPNGERLIIQTPLDAKEEWDDFKRKNSIVGRIFGEDVSEKINEYTSPILNMFYTNSGMPAITPGSVNPMIMGIDKMVDQGENIRQKVVNNEKVDPIELTLPGDILKPSVSSKINKSIPNKQPVKVLRRPNEQQTKILRSPNEQSNAIPISEDINQIFKNIKELPLPQDPIDVQTINKSISVAQKIANKSGFDIPTENVVQVSEKASDMIGGGGAYSLEHEVAIAPNKKVGIHELMHHIQKRLGENIRKQNEEALEWLKKYKSENETWIKNSDHPDEFGADKAMWRHEAEELFGKKLHELTDIEFLQVVDNVRKHGGYSEDYFKSMMKSLEDAKLKYPDYDNDAFLKDANGNFIEEPVFIPGTLHQIGTIRKSHNELFNLLRKNGHFLSLGTTVVGAGLNSLIRKFGSSKNEETY